MYVISHDPESRGKPAPPRNTGREASLVLVASLGSLRERLVGFIEAALDGDPSPERSVAAGDLVDAFNDVHDATKALLEPVYREPEEALAHGIAVGLWHAGHPSAIRDFPKTTRQYLWSLPYSFRGELLRQAAKAR